MSSFYGIWNRNGKAVTPQKAQSMQNAFDWWGPDESRFILEKNLMIGQATLWNTPESKHEHLPLRQGPYILAADARIDNRAELARLLDLPNQPLEEIGDGEFILAAYKKWGENCADKLLGDFAFAIWDESKQGLFCARDFIGVRPFYYYINESRFLFGSDLETLVKTSHIKPTIRDESVANFLIQPIFTEQKHTFFKEFMRLEGGTTLFITKEEYRIKRYWHPEKVEKKKLSSEDEWIEEIKILLEDSVKARLRSAYPIASHLSGGLDSSPIAALAARQLKKNNPSYKMQAYSWQPKPSKTDNPNHFEWSYVLELAKQENIELKFSELSSARVLEGMKTLNPLYDKGAQLWNELDTRSDSRKIGVRTLLSGWGGDEFITNHGHAHLVQMFLEGHWSLLKKRLCQHGKCKNLRWLVAVLYKKIFIPLLPNRLYCHMPYINCNTIIFDYYTSDFLPLVKDAWRKKNHIFVRYTSTSIRKDLIRAWENGHVQGRLNCWSQEAFSSHIQYTFPLLDRRLVELSFSLPIKYAIVNGYDRYLYRKAIEGLVPKNLLWGKHKQEPKRWLNVAEIYLENIQHIKNDILYKENKYVNYKIVFYENIEKLLKIYYLLLHLNKR